MVYKILTKQRLQIHFNCYICNILKQTDWTLGIISIIFLFWDRFFSQHKHYHKIIHNVGDKCLAENPIYQVTRRWTTAKDSWILNIYSKSPLKYVLSTESKYLCSERFQTIRRWPRIISGVSQSALWTKPPYTWIFRSSCLQRSDL